ncbi:FAD-binding oxidoreductase [Planosporangium thailandense]|uniref:D-lactate dehydrogenase (cytochrome) n=1 Tax=Planosporangium thailandense TaxID=765197 RepID=A0ABX0Y472_9ACTN|nr:FAD-binding and (Fe-S)-binding domain-containing protein [Planosporangium thailandense]NJC72937.1 FAD-binding oxidoreductase [Planosporangium thailandense]
MAVNRPLDRSALEALRALSDPGNVRTRPIDLAAMAHDASHYLRQPRVVVTARDADHVAGLLRLAADNNLPVTFRSGGTSLSGQAGSNDLLVDTRRNFRRVEVLDDGARVRSQPGATVRAVNARLAPYRTKLGPDPASEAACTVGGVLANNSSGMACGTALNAYHTLRSMTFVLPSGTVVDTAHTGADDLLRTREPRLWQGLAELRDRVRGNADSVARIRHQFSMKNTMGYSLNALLDFDRPVDILSHLLVGSEGTLAFIAEAVFDTVPVRPHVATALLVFDSLRQATDSVPGLLAAGARTVELMDAASLRVVQREPQGAAVLAGVRVRSHTALLVELQAATTGQLDAELAAASSVLATLALSTAARFTTDPAERATLWHLRKGLYTLVAGARPLGSTALLEDIVVPLDRLTDTTERLTALFARYGYDDAVIFGHAKDGNLHFLINPRFDDPDELSRYEAFTEDLVDLVLGANGSLKAEHGTGRIMAPYVRRQFGDELYGVMRAIKDLCDPAVLLNPGTVLSDDPRTHLKDLKIPLPADPAVDTCVECGYCEPVCPSQDLTTTPRQRIVIMREIAAADAAGDTARARALRRDFGYDAVDTCAADSMCRSACPVGIDTGSVMKADRERRHSATAQRAGATAAAHWGGTVNGLRAALRVADALPTNVLSAGSRAARRILSEDWVPQLGADLPGAGPRRPRPRTPGDAAAVFFPACINALFGPAVDGDDTMAVGAATAFQSLCERAGLALAVPDGVAGLCCGTPWKSKGLTRGYDVMAHRTFEAVWAASDGGRLPVVCDASSCGLGLREIGAHLTGDAADSFAALPIVDAVTYTRTDVLPRLTVTRRVASVAVHPTCSSEHLGSTADLLALADACADSVTVPATWRCCGFAGDRGLLHPEVTAAATRPEAAELAGARFDEYVSNNRTCELGMSRATGHTYRHILELLEACTR